MRSRRVAVIVIACDGSQWIPNCLESLRGASRDRVGLCVVDNGGNQGTVPQRLNEFDYVRLQTPERLGFAEANNFALRELGLGFDLVCFLNQDTLGRAGWLDACASAFEDEPQLGAVSPLLRTYDGADWDPGFRDCARHSPQFVEDARTGGPFAAFYDVPRVTAAAMVVRAKIIEESGPFDPIFGSYYEDYDLCRRIRRGGYRIGICGRGTVCHFSGSSTTTEQARRKRMRQIIRNRAILRIRESGDHRWREFARYLACTLPYNLGRSLFQTHSSQPLGVQLRANWELLAQWRRLVSQRHDHFLWTEYLSEIGWPSGKRPGAKAEQQPAPVLPKS